MASHFLKRNRNNIQKYFEIFFTKVIIALKENKEYKANLWNALITNVVSFLVILLFFSALSPLLGEILGWTFRDYILYISMLLLLGKVHMVFTLKFLQRVLLNGDFNTILLKPVNSFFYFSTQFKGVVLVTFSIFLLINLFLIFLYYNFSFIFLFYFLFSIIYVPLFFSFFISTAFFMKENSMFVNIPRQLNNRIKEFTPRSFENYSFGFLLYILPSGASAFILIEILRGNFIYSNIILKIIFPSFLLIVLGIYVMWKIGLKKYEAFG
jgi:ABC-type uncharacterized transport system permease subunit